MALAAVSPKGEAKSDWAIIRALSAHIGKTLPYDNLSELRAKLFEDHPTFCSLEHIEPTKGFNPAKLGQSGKPTSGAFVNPISDFYLTNPIARASHTLAECSKLTQDSALVEAAE